MSEGTRFNSLEDQLKHQDKKIQEFMEEIQQKMENFTQKNNEKMESFMLGIENKFSDFMKLMNINMDDEEQSANLRTLDTPCSTSLMIKSEELQMPSIGILNAIVPTNNSLAFKYQEGLLPYANCNEKSIFANATVLEGVEQNVFDESSQLNSCFGDQDIETTRKHNFTCFIEGLSKKKESLKSFVEPLEKRDSEGRIKVLLTDYEAFSSTGKSSQEGIETYQEFQEKMDVKSFMAGTMFNSSIVKKFEWRVINPEMVLNVWSECLKGDFSWGRSNSLPKFNAKYHEFTASSEFPTQRLVGLTRGFHQYHVLYLISENDWLVMKHTKKWKNTSFATRENASCEIIGRSLVTASRKGSQGTIKVCRMHDLLRDFCLSKAKEENFLQLVTGCDEPYASFSDLDIDVNYIDYYPSEPVKYEKHRVCIYLNRKHFFNSSPSGPCTPSLICFATNDQYPTCPYDLSFIPNNFKLLKVLDLENINMGTSFPSGIELLVQLRNLAACGDIEFIPPAISKLQKLETFIVKGLKGKVQLPNSIWCMERLRYLHVNRSVYFNFQTDKPGTSLLLINLVSFSSPSLAYGKYSKRILRRFPNLRKLRCTYLESWDSFTNYSKFPVLDFLIQLQSLKVLYIGRIPKNSGELNLPWNLKKLTLSNFRLPWAHIGAIGKLQNFEVLKLLSKAFDGERWDMRKGEFLELKYLKLDALNIAQWNASNDHFPKLEQLVLHDNFGEIMVGWIHS